MTYTENPMPKKESKTKEKTKVTAIMPEPVLESNHAPEPDTRPVVVVQPPSSLDVSNDEPLVPTFSAEAQTKVNVAQEIWTEIKDVNLNLFALPGQTVEMYCHMIPVEPSRLYMTIKVSSVLTALEDALGKKFNFEVAGKFILVSRK